MPNSPASGNYRYNNGFWAKDIYVNAVCATQDWVSFASGYGGILVAFLPTDATYMYFSDDGEVQQWAEAAQEADSISC